MKSQVTTYEGFTTEEADLLEGIIKADALQDAQLAGLENLLERKADATLGLPQLRHLRQACERMRQLLGRYEKSPVARFAASR
jgi:dipeptidase